MASQGPNFPGTVASLANAGTSEDANAWISPANASADDGAEASITAATYDTPDISELLVCSNFGFTIPAGATIDGIVVEIDRRCFAATAEDFRVQLSTTTAFSGLVGDNKGDPNSNWPSTSTVRSYGGAADAWNAGLTAAQINDAGFAVMLSVRANGANTDIGVDFVRVTVHYTAGAVTHQGTLDVAGAGSFGIDGTVVPPGGGPTVYGSDDYGRTIASGNGLGSADVGGAYTVSSNAGLGVNGSEAQYINTGSTQKWAVLAVNQQDVEIRFRWRVASLGGAGETMDVSALGRFLDASNYYRMRAVIDSAGNVTIRASKFVGASNVTIGSIFDPSLVAAAGDWINVRVQIEGNGTTTLRMKVWLDSGSEPGSWQISETDTEATLQAAGSAGWRILPSAATYTTTTGVDTLRIESIGAGSVTHQGTLSATGAGSASFGPTMTLSGAIAITGSGALAEAPGLRLSSTLAPSGSGSLSSAGGLRLSAAMTLGGTGAIGFVGSLRAASTLPLTGAGAFGPSGTLRSAGSISLAGAGSFAASAGGTIGGEIAFSGTGSVGLTGGVRQSGALSATGSGSFAATPIVRYAGGLAVSATGTLGLEVAGTIPGALALTGSGAFSAAGTRFAVASASFAGSGALGASGGLLRDATLSAAGSGSLGLSAGLRLAAIVGFAGSGSIVESGGIRHSGSIAFPGSGSITLAGTIGGDSSLSATGSGALGLAGTVQRAGSLSTTGTGAGGFAGRLSLGASFAPAGDGLFGASGTYTAAAELGFSGTGVLGLEGESIPPFYPLAPGTAAAVTLAGLSATVRRVRTPVNLVGIGAKVDRL